MNVAAVALVSILLSVAAQFMLKAGISGPDVKAALAQPLGIRTVAGVLLDARVLGGFVLYGLGAIVWLSVLARWDVSKAYPLVGLGFALTIVVGWALGEQVGLVRIVGVALICAGVWMVGRS